MFWFKRIKFIQNRTEMWWLLLALYLWSATTIILYILRAKWDTNTLIECKYNKSLRLYIALQLIQLFRGFALQWAWFYNILRIWIDLQQFNNAFWIELFIHSSNLIFQWFKLFWHNKILAFQNYFLRV